MTLKYFKITKLVSVILIIFVLGCCFAFMGYQVKCYGLVYFSTIKQISKEVGVDPHLVIAICKTESGFKANVVSLAGAIGFMQILPGTAEYVCKLYNLNYSYQKLFEWKYNVTIGCYYLLYLQTKFDYEWVIAAYNAGEGNVSTWINKGLTINEIPFLETKNYLTKVKQNLDYYCALFE